VSVSISQTRLPEPECAAEFDRDISATLLRSSLSAQVRAVS
jgi:hypothetical protein